MQAFSGRDGACCRCFLGMQAGGREYKQNSYECVQYFGYQWIMDKNGMSGNTGVVSADGTAR